MPRSAGCWGWRGPLERPDGFVLSKDEIRVILKSGDYFRARLLVDADLQIPIPEDAKPATFD